jgi:hypothetical protein
LSAVIAAKLREKSDVLRLLGVIFLAAVVAVPLAELLALAKRPPTSSTQSAPTTLNFSFSSNIPSLSISGSRQRPGHNKARAVAVT